MGLENVTIDDLINVLRAYNPEEIEIIKKAYDYAFSCHKDMKRKSGEPYIIHPLHVAYELAKKYADRDTICAALLHDVVEDCNVSLETISDMFNPVIAFLVDGVTKLSKVKNIDKSEAEIANMNKILKAIIKDARIIMIKLEDRRHNMRTLEFLPAESQIRIAKETQLIYLPLAYNIGAYDILNDFEDLTFKYINPSSYNMVLTRMNNLRSTHDEILETVLQSIDKVLTEKEIPHELKKRIKNIYGVYRKLVEHRSLVNIHDLLALKIIVDNEDQCYRGLGCVHSVYRPYTDKFKDYIAIPKTNQYRSLHTTVFGPQGWFVQAQLRTSDMENHNIYGLASYWKKYRESAVDLMQFDLSQDYQFYRDLIECYNLTPEDGNLFELVKQDLLSRSIFVYTATGIPIEIPEGATVVDFAYRLGSDQLIGLYGAVVNGHRVSISQELHSKDIISLLRSPAKKTPPSKGEITRTIGARKKILELTLENNPK